MSDYRSVTYLAYRVSLEASRTTGALSKTRALFNEAEALKFAGGPLWYDLVVGELRTLALRAQSAHAKAFAALDECWALGKEGGAVIRVSDGKSLRWDEDEGTRDQVRACYKIASEGAREALLAVELAQLLLGRAKEECIWSDKQRVRMQAGGMTNK